MGWKEFTGKTVEEAITNACTDFVVPSDKLEVDVLEKESKGFLGIFSHQARIRARLKEENKKEAAAPDKKETEKQAKQKEQMKPKEQEKEQSSSEKEKSTASFSESSKLSRDETEKLIKDKKQTSFSEKPPVRELTEEEQQKIKHTAEEFLTKVCEMMQLDVILNITYRERYVQLDINVEGDDLGILIGKRGQTLDSLQYLVSLVVNKEASSYVKVKLDTENYRQRRRETLENLAKNIAYKVKKTRQPVTLEPMNPYERRIIHSVLQHDRFIETHSEGDEPYRKVVVTVKEGYSDYNRGGRNNYNSNYHKNNYNRNYRNRRQSNYENRSADTGVQSEE